MLKSAKRRTGLGVSSGKARRVSFVASMLVLLFCGALCVFSPTTQEPLLSHAVADPCPPDGCGGPTGPSGPSQSNGGNYGNQGPPRTAARQAPASPGPVPQGQVAQANPMNGAPQPGNLGVQQPGTGMRAGSNANLDPPDGAAPTFAANQGPFPNDPPQQAPQPAQLGQQPPAQQPPAQQPAQPQQQAPQPAQQAPAQQQPGQDSDQGQQVKDLQDQLDQLKGRRQQDLGKIRELEEQVQKLLAAGKQKRDENKDKDKDKDKNKNKNKDKDKDKDKDQNDQALAGGDPGTDGAPLIAAALGAALAAGSRRKQGKKDQGPDQKALQEDATEAATGAPPDAMSAVESGQDIASGASSAAQGFGQAGQAGASFASAAQSGSVNPQDAQQLVQGVAQGVQGTASAVAAGTQEAQLAENDADQALRALEDANPQLKPQIDQLRQTLAQGQQTTQAAGQAANLVSQGAGAVNQLTGSSGSAPVKEAGQPYKMDPGDTLPPAPGNPGMTDGMSIPFQSDTGSSGSFTWRNGMGNIELNIPGASRITGNFSWFGGGQGPSSVGKGNMNGAGGSASGSSAMPEMSFFSVDGTYTAYSADGKVLKAGSFHVSRGTADSGSTMRPQKKPGELPEAPPTDGSINISRSSTAYAQRVTQILQKKNLPQTGEMPFVPKSNWKLGDPLPTGPNGGFIDNFGNEWVPGRPVTPGDALEWDVQPPRNGFSPRFRDFTRDGTHINVDLRGNISHGRRIVH